MKHNKRYYVFMVLCLLLTLIISGCSKIVNDNTIEHIDNEKSQKLTITNMTDMMSQEMMNDVRQNYLNSIDNDFQVDDNTKIDVIVKTGNNSVAEMFLSQKKIKTLSDYIASENGQALIAVINNKQTEVKNRITEAEIEIEYSRNFTTLLNGFGATISKKDIAILKAIEGVESVIISETYNAPTSTNGLFDSMQDTGIFKNESKYKGEGMLIAVIDTGLDYTHSAFSKELSKVNYTEEQMNSVIKEAALEGKYYSSKVAYMYDYADKDNDVYPNEDHGTHVAGIAAGDNDVITGVAPNAQLAIMKVFGDNGGGGRTIDILAAITDSTIIGVDVINMSLGSGCGYTEMSSSSYDFLTNIYNMVEKLGITICAAAGNDFYNTLMSSYRGSLSTNPDTSTVGSPSTYHASFSVAAANISPIYYIVANGEQGMMYNNAVNMESEPYEFNDILNGNENVKLSYVLVPGVGSKGDYADVDVNGKIAIISRGDISFEEKQKIAAENGAVACIIFNHEQGEINMQIENLVIPSCSINLDNGKYFISNPVGYITMGKDTYTGPDMASYSSWGPAEGLYIKPEITAPGTDILSSIIGEEYVRMPGTSMASPNMAGLMAVVRQYLRDKFPTMSEIELYDMAYQMVMSTADTVNDKYGIPNAVRKQGAGMANLNSVLSTNAYLTVTGSNRTKIELGSDKKQTGIYTLNFNVVNFGNEAVSYELDTITLTETVIDNIIRNAAKILYDNEVEVSVRNGEYNDGIVTVAGNSTARVSVTITLTTENKNYIKSTFKNGMYVEGFVKLNNTDKNGVSLSIPWLAFFGDYDALPVFDSDIYDDVAPQNYDTVPLALYREEYLIPLGMFPYNLEDASKIPAVSKEKIALSNVNTALNNIYSIYTGLLRNVDRIDYYLEDKWTGEVIWSAYADYVKKTYCNTSYGQILPMGHTLELKPEQFNLKNNQMLEMKIVASYEDNDNTFTYSFPIYIDNEAPMLLDSKMTEKDGVKTMEMTMYDNRYICDVWFFVQTPSGLLQPLTDEVIPVDTSKWGENISISLDVTKMFEDLYFETVYFVIEDYAMNSSLFALNLDGTIKEEQVTPVQPQKEEFEIDENGTLVAYNGQDSVVVIPENVTSIGVNAFNNNQIIETVDMSKAQIVSIKDYAFRYCSELKNIIFSNALTEIAAYGFADCISLERIVLPDSIKKICDGAFMSCTSLKSADLPGENAAEFGWQVFAKTNNMKLFVNEKQFNYYSGLAQFKGNTDIISLSDFVTENNVLVKYTGSEEFIRFPSTIEIIGKNAFSGNASIKSIDFDDIIAINEEAFKDCINLNSLVIPDTIKAIKDRAFMGCSALIKVEFMTITPAEFGADIFDNHNEKLEIIVPINCKELYLAKETMTEYNDIISEKEYFTIDRQDMLTYYLGNSEKIVIPENVKFIDMEVFKDNKAVKEIILPEGLVAIGPYAFSGCSNLSKIIIPESVKSIWTGAFKDCISLKSINFTENQIFVYDYVFSGTGIEELEIPNTIEFLYENSLSEMPMLKKLTINSQIFSSWMGYYSIYLNDVIKNNPKLETLILNGQILEIGASGDANIYGCDALKEIIINADSAIITGNSFSSLSGLEKVEINGYISEISGNAFNSNAKLNEVVLNGMIDTISEGAFNNCPMLKKYSIAENSLYYSMDEYGVLYNKEMTRIYRQPEGWDYSGTYIIPDTVIEMDEYAFSSNGTGVKSLLTGVEFPENMEYIPVYAFMNAINLKSIEFNNISLIDDYSFANTGIEIINLTDNFEYLGMGAFAECKSLNTVNISKDTTEFVFSRVFVDCDNIKAINAEEGNKSVCVVDGSIYNGAMTLLDMYDFFNTSDATEFVIPDTVVKISAYAFMGNNELQKITIPANVMAIGHKAFFATENLTEYHFLGEKAPLLEGCYEENSLSQYANFYAYVENIDKKLTIYHPINGEHYYNFVWSSIFAERKEVNNDGTIIGNTTSTNTNSAILNDKRYIF